MSFSAICPAINEQLLNLANGHTPALKSSQVGTLRAVSDQYNRYNVNIVPLNRQNGQIKTVQVMYQKRSTINEVTSTVDSCLNGPFDESDNFAENVTINFQAGQQFKYTEENIRELCESRNSWVTKDIANRLDAMRQYINNDIITEMIANAGNYAGGVNSGTTPAALNLLEPIATGGITVGNYIGEATMLNALSDARVSGLPMAIGNGDLRTYTKMQKIGCCNNGGIDMASAGQFAYFEDDQLTTALANNNFYVLEAGALQFIPVPFYLGEYETLTETETRSTIVDPLIPGLVYDFKIYKPQGCDEWNAQLSLHYAISALYNNNYRTGDPLLGVNGIFQFNAAV